MDIRVGQREIVARWDNVVESELCTAIANESGVTVHTVEHLLAALHGCEIDNAVIELDGPEVPIMDGSAAPFVTLLEGVGVTQQPVARRARLITRPVAVNDNDRFAMLLPSTEPRLTVEIDFPNPAVGRQRYSVALNPDTFAREIAPARTFGFANELHALHNRGLAKGGSLHAAILVDDKSIVNEEGLRFADEFVRHKMLDCVGDLALLGVPVIGHLVTYKPGHRLCHQLLRALDAAGTAASVTVVGGGELRTESLNTRREDHVRQEKN
jgi:UDP-3-O-[3-hydroxymyristoyl] N-acetylglucosamine deacetylase